MGWTPNAAGILVPDDQEPVVPLEALFSTMAGSIAAPPDTYKTYAANPVNTFVGDGFFQGRYRVALGVCTWSFLFQLGSTSSITGTFAFTIPVETNVIDAWVPIGYGIANDNSNVANRTVIIARLSTPTSCNLFFGGGGVGGSVNGTSPFTWAENDRISIGGSYLVA